MPPRKWFLPRPVMRAPAKFLIFFGLLGAILIIRPFGPGAFRTASGQVQKVTASNAGDHDAYVAVFKTAVTTLFWVGEQASHDNGYISNTRSHWDAQWVSRFGGVDDPAKRRGYSPAAFKPHENPFYVALPFADTDEDGNFKPAAKEVVPDSKGRLTKNRWVEVRYKGKSCYGQWEDAGPFGEDDFDWVFGEASRPQNHQGERAGLDVSPAIESCLSLKGLDKTEWRLVNEEEVPDGPWREVVTSR